MVFTYAISCSSVTTLIGGDLSSTILAGQEHHGEIMKRGIEAQGPLREILLRYGAIHPSERNICRYVLALLLWVAICLLGQAQSVIEVYNEKGIMVSRFRGSVDSLLTHIEGLPKSRYLVSLSTQQHSDTSLTSMSLRCLFNDAFCQSRGPLEPDTLYEASGFYDGHWISFDRRGDRPHILWEKQVSAGYIHGLCIEAISK